MRHQLQLLSLPATPNHLILQDLSQYRDDFVDYPRLELFLPGQVKSVTLPFSASETNVITKAQTGGSLPDGIYTAYYSVAPHDQVNVCYTFLRTEHLQCQLDAWLQQIDWSYEPISSENYQILTQISGLLLGAKAEVNHNPKTAESYYRLAKSLLPQAGLPK